MSWNKLDNGSFEKRDNGVLLVIDPQRHSLHVEVEEYHARPVDIDLAELQDVMAEHEAEVCQQLLPLLRRHWRLVSVALAVLEAREGHAAEHDSAMPQ
jgi:hypothetical protein